MNAINTRRWFRAHIRYICRMLVCCRLMSLQDSGQLQNNGQYLHRFCRACCSASPSQSVLELQPHTAQAYMRFKLLFASLSMFWFPLCAGDSHSAALDEHGTVFAWGTFRGDSGVFGFAPDTRISLLPTAVVKPTSADEQVVRVVSGTIGIHNIQHMCVACAQVLPGRITF